MDFDIIWYQSTDSNGKHLVKLNQEPDLKESADLTDVQFGVGLR